MNRESQTRFSLLSNFLDRWTKVWEALLSLPAASHSNVCIFSKPFLFSLLIKSCSKQLLSLFVVSSYFRISFQHLGTTDFKNYEDAFYETFHNFKGNQVFLSHCFLLFFFKYVFIIFSILRNQNSETIPFNFVQYREN